MVRSIDLPDATFIREVLNLDKAVYSPEWQDTYESVYARYRANPDSYSLLYEGDTLIGYVCAFPIKAKLVEKIMDMNHSFDSDIQASDIEVFETGNSYVLYLISAVVCPIYQGCGFSKLLLKNLYEDLYKKMKDGIKVSQILAVAVTEGGRRLLDSVGFRGVKQHTDGGILHTKCFSCLR